MKDFLVLGGLAVEYSEGVTLEKAALGILREEMRLVRKEFQKIIVVRGNG